jgi:hypothetical protein
MTLLATAVPVISQDQHLMEKDQLKSFLSEVNRHSQHWETTISSIDIASISEPNHPTTKVMEKRQRACLTNLNNLQGEIVTLEKKTLLSNQISVLNGLTNASDCLGALQDGLAFEGTLALGGAPRVARFEKWEKWETDLTVAFEESTADAKKMYEHMVGIAQIVDSKIDADTLTKNNSKPGAKIQ